MAMVPASTLAAGRRRQRATTTATDQVRPRATVAEIAVLPSFLPLLVDFLVVDQDGCSSNDRVGSPVAAGGDIATVGVDWSAGDPSDHQKLHVGGYPSR